MKHVFAFEKKKDFEEFEIIVQHLSAALLECEDLLKENFGLNQVL